MATRSAKIVDLPSGYRVITWEQLEENAGTKDVGAGVNIGELEGVTVQAVGNFDTDAVVTMQGSNDATNYATIGSGTLALATPFCTISERPLLVRPAITTNGAGDASDLDIILVGFRRR